MDLSSTSQVTIQRPPHLRGTLHVPGDKSISHRAAILNAIAHGDATVSNLSPGADVASTLRCLRDLGVAIDHPNQDPTHIRIRGQGLGALQEPQDVLDAGNSGSTLRMLAGVLASRPFLSILTGDASLRSRPVHRVVEPLRLMGACLIARDADRRPPLVILGGDLKPIEYTLPVASAQVKTAILLAGLAAQGQTTIHQPAVSRDHTERMLRAMGILVEEDGLAIRIRPTTLRAHDVRVPGDISSAAFWLVAAVCHPDAELRLPGVGVNPTRTGVLEVLQAMGADITMEDERLEGGEPVATLVARSSSLRAVEIGGDTVVRAIDEIPILAVAACFARGTTVIRDAQELRVKESDRIAATVQGLALMGARVQETPDGMVIQGTGCLNGAQVQSHGDHRIAMALAIAGLLAKGHTTVLGTEAVDISYPGFWHTLQALCPEGQERPEDAAPPSKSQGAQP